jgi:hypothetical protein
MRRTLILWGVVLGLMVVGCAAKDDLENETIMYGQMMGPPAEAPAAEPTKVPEAVPTVKASEPPVKRLIIRDASLELVVRDTQAALDEITARVDELGGYVVSSRMYKYDEGTRVNLTVRVPADALDATLAQWRDMALEVRHQVITGQDVTEEYADVSSRLRHLEATEARLLTFLEEAEDTEATLAVYGELQQVQGEIERLKGRVQYLEGASALSQVSIELIPDEMAGPIDVAGWRPQGTLRQAVEALVRTLQFLVEALIWVGVYVLPLGLLLMGAPGAVVVWWVRRWRRRRE